MTKVQLLQGDCRALMATLPDKSIDAIVTDPPYELTSARPGGRSEATRGAVMGGFMGMKWDGTGVAFDVETWRQALRVLKPGGHLLAFSGTRTYHRMVCAIEDAGFEVRDMILWHYGQGFPKSLNLDNERGKTICGCEDRPSNAPQGDAEHQMHGVRHAVSPAAVTRGPRADTELQQEVQRRAEGRGLGEARVQGPGGTQDVHTADRTREPGLEGRCDAQAAEGQLQGRALCARAGVGEAYGPEGRLHHGAPACDGAALRLPADTDGSGGPSGSQPVEQRPEQSAAVPDERGPQTWRGWPVCGRCGKPVLPRGLGTALKPATEPIVVARKPLDGTVAANVLQHGTGALNIDGCRVAAPDGRPLIESRSEASLNAFGNGLNGSRCAGTTTEGRWPANVIHDGSDEVLAAFAQFGESVSRQGKPRGSAAPGDGWGMTKTGAEYNDEGTPARFFYCAKASKRDRGEGNTHPTVKPTDLMRYLCRLVTPPGGVVLDPFLGSGSTGKAAALEGFEFIGYDLSAEYIAIARQRIEGLEAAPPSVAQPEKPQKLAPAAQPLLPIDLFA